MANILGTKKSDFIHVAGDGLVAPAGYKDNPNATNTGDQIDISQGGDDQVFAGGGSDTILAGAKLSAGDKIDGQGGNDILVLDGDYSTLVKFQAGTIQNIETIQLAAGHDYNFRTDDGNISNFAVVLLDASALSATNWLHLDAHLELDASYNVIGGAGDDVITTALLGGYFDLTRGGNDHVVSITNQGSGALGSAEFNFGTTFDTNDYADGSSTGILDLAATTPTFLELNGSYVRNFAEINLSGPFTIVADSNFIDWQLQNNETVIVRGEGYSGNDPLSFDASADAQTASAYILAGGGGDDTLIGGKGFDQFWGLHGKDVLTPGPGSDLVNYGSDGAIESTSITYDQVVGFSFKKDQFRFYNDRVDAIRSAVTTGTLSTATFDSDLHNALLSANNGAHTAVLFTPDAGTLAGHLFLIVDKDGAVGYTAGADYVIELVSPNNLDHLSLNSFALADAGPP